MMARAVLFLMLFIMTSSPVLAAPSVGGATCTPLITPSYGQCNTADLEHIFSGYVCQYETIVADIFSQVYCSVRQELASPLQILLILFMAVLGAAILMGVVPFTAKDMMIALFRVALLAGFVLQSEFIVTIFYKGLMGFISSGVDVVMSAGGGGTGRSIYERFDTYINDFTGSTARESAKGATAANQCADSAIPMLITMMFVIPPMFLLGVMVGFRIILTFLRAMVGYLFAITAIMFLMVLSPLFLGAGLFAITRPLFDKWVRYSLSFAIQVLVVFAFIGLILSMGIMEDFSRLKNLSVPYTGSTWQPDARVTMQNICTICAEPNADFSGCNDATPVPPTGMTGFLQITRLIASESLNLLLLAFLIDAVLKLAPSVATALGGSPSVPQVSGNMVDSIAGMQSLGAFGRNASQSFMRGTGGLPGRAQASVSAGYSALFRGGPQSQGIVGEFLGSIIRGGPR